MRRQIFRQSKQIEAARVTPLPTKFATNDGKDASKCAAKALAGNCTVLPEIEHKASRPYIVLLIRIAENTFAVPFRTNVRHPYCYKFKNSGRDTSTVTGLDYTKAVIVNDPDYIGDPATIDDREYLELSGKYHFIIKQFSSYVTGYFSYVDGNVNPYNEKKYRFSTLRYFHKELNINP